MTSFHSRAAAPFNPELPPPRSCYLKFRAKRGLANVCSILHTNTSQGLLTAPLRGPVEENSVPANALSRLCKSGISHSRLTSRCSKGSSSLPRPLPHRKLKAFLATHEDSFMTTPATFVTGIPATHEAHAAKKPSPAQKLPVALGDPIISRHPLLADRGESNILGRWRATSIWMFFGRQILTVSLGNSTRNQHRKVSRRSIPRSTFHSLSHRNTSVAWRRRAPITPGTCKLEGGGFLYQFRTEPTSAPSCWRACPPQLRRGRAAPRYSALVSRKAFHCARRLIAKLASSAWEFRMPLIPTVIAALCT